MGAYSCVVDVGGDEGQFIPDTIDAAQRLVFDVSAKPLRTGVERIGDHEELRTARPGLVIMAHVLEHLSDPLRQLREIYDASPIGSVFYAEVPLDRPQLSRYHRTDLYRLWLQATSRAKGVFMALDFLTGACRQLFGKVPALGIVKQSEHVSYFSPDSLGAILRSAGYDVLHYTMDRNAKTGSYRLGRLGMVAVKT